MYKHCGKHIIAAMAFLSPAIEAQIATPLQFEVASIKPSAPGAHGPNLYNPTHGKFAAESITAKALIAYANDLQEFRISGGPNWLGSEPYDVVAKAEGEASDQSIKMMVRSLLAERFGLKTHRESKEMPLYALVVAKGGSKLHSSEGDGPQVRGGAGGSAPQKVLIAQKVNMEMFASQLAARVMVRPVLNRTGLSGDFDIKLEWSVDESGPSIFSALPEQLGLRLEAQKGLVDVLVIDQIEKPSAN